MKKMILFTFTLLLMTISQISNANILGISVKVSVSGKAFWNGTGCEPRESGGCCHIEVSTNILKLTNTGGILTLEASLDILKNPDYRSMFTDGYFYTGLITIEKSALEQIKYQGNSTFPDKPYPFKIEKGTVIIQLN